MLQEVSAERDDEELRRRLSKKGKAALLSASFKELIGRPFARRARLLSPGIDAEAFAFERSLAMSNKLYRKRGIALDLQQLQTFQMVAVTGSFTRAAAALGYSQSNVTHQIKILEERLGYALFDRQRFSRRAVLTEAGRHVLDYSKRILDLVHGLHSKESMANGF